MPAHILTIDIYDSHTQADKIDRLLFKKNYYINYSLLQLTIAIRVTIPGMAHSVDIPINDIS
jgi:hypothetical protein